MKSLGLFASLSLAASVLHYLFQVLLARVLGPQPYTVFTGDWAQLQLLLMIATCAQWWAGLRPLAPTRGRTYLVTCHAIGALAVTGFLISRQWPMLVVGVLAAAIAHALMLGRWWEQGAHGRMGMVNLLQAVVKIGLLPLLPFLGFDTTNVLLLLYASYLLAHLLMALWPAPSVRNDATPVSATAWAAVTMAFATHFFPQAEVLWAQYAHPAALAQIAPLSLLTRGIFFLQLIIAQWWLPKARQTPGLVPRFSALMPLTLSALLMWPAALIGRPLLAWSLGWNNLPPTLSFFLAALHAAFMAWHFQALQLAVVQARLTSAVLGLTALLLTWGVASSWSSAEAYFTIVGATHGLAFLFLQRQNGKA